MKKMNWKNKIRSGFTMLETLTVVAIIAILSAVVLLGVSGMQKSLRQTELDSKAQIIYAAAQNRFAELRASGRESVYKDNGNLVQLAEGENANSEIAVLMSDDTALADAVLPIGSVDNELRGHDWYIEYKMSSGSVQAVYYTESDGFYFDTDAATLTSRSARLAAGAKVGYYGGEAVDVGTVKKLSPKIDINNGEELTATFSCPESNGSFASLSFTYVISDGEKKAEGPLIKNTDYTCKLTLDSMKEGKHFKDLFPDLTPGADITITVKVKNTVDGSVGTYQTKVNSLFDDKTTGGTAYISCARHLQNLDVKTSGVTDTITAARQINSVSFDEWNELYKNLAFTPINNDKLNSYTGAEGDSRFVITGLTENVSGDNAGLFGTFSGTELNGITMIDAKVSGTGGVGALAGRTTSSKLTVSGCQVYLKNDVNSLKGDDLNAVLAKASISGGTNAGGLIGAATAKVNIKDSFAATVTTGGNNSSVGGLIGTAGAGATIENAYSDCYLGGQDVGGLVGGGSAAITHCYTAGFQKATGSSAGLVRGDANMTSCYSAVSHNGGSVYTTAMSGSADQVYYLNSNGTHIANTAAKTTDELSDSGFTLNTFVRSGSTRAYNLIKGMGLSGYPFPRLAMTHYGDWAADFVDGLVYYEKYGENDYGFYGANIDALKDKTPVGDGYAWAFSEGGDGRLAVTYEGKNYYLKPLDKGQNNKFDKDNFYQSIESGGKTYYFNPLFAKSVTDHAALEKDDVVFIRTARQLNALSQYYGQYAEKYKTVMPLCTFSQEQNIDYASYDWADYAAVSAALARAQASIGTEKTPFSATYDGGGKYITNVSFNAPEGSCAGMFGKNSGMLKNIVLAQAYSEDAPAYFALSKAGSSTSVEGAGKNAYMGALAGFNSGRITNCAVAGYTSTVYTYYGTSAYVGGLVGFNEGVISASAANCPDITAQTNYSNSYFAAFVGYNTGVISSSYALGALDVTRYKTGSVILSGFTAANGGICKDCYCTTALTSAGQAGSYAFAPKGGSFSSCYYLDEGTYQYAGDLYYYPADKTGAGTGVDEKGLMALQLSGFGAVENTYFNSITQGSYPYPGCVTDKLGYAHYGDWPEKADLGNYGMFYWEYESGSANSGYHISYLGDTGVKGNTLCISHNDGGVIDAYGYGYYAKDGVSISQSTSGVNVGQTVDAVRAAFGEQFESYSFTACQTTGTTAAESNKMYISGGNVNATWKINGKTFTFNPFFGNSMTASDTSGLGSEGTPYQVRSVDQLQFINWNTNEKNAKTDEGGHSAEELSANNKYYIYLQDSGAGWVQQHDIRQPESESNFVPIGQAGCNYKASYNGGEYQIINLRISSSSQFVGLFGEVGNGAKIINVSMYSDDNTGLIESTYYGRSNTYLNGYDTATVDYQPSVGALIGFVWGGNGAVTVDNCTAAGYKVQYRGVTQTKRYITVGGLVGTLYMGKVNNCSAVNDVKSLNDNSVALKHNKINNNINTANVREQLGGLVGTNGGSNTVISNSYSGGKLTPSRNNYLLGGIAGNNRCKQNNGSELTGDEGWIKNCYTYCKVDNSKAPNLVSTYPIAPNSYDLNNDIVNCYYFQDNAAGTAVDRSQAMTYAQMCDGKLLNALNNTGAGFSTVTVYEDGAYVPGKYSFPGNDSSLEGQNYPFPTILTQTNEHGTVSVHYGAWPKVGMFLSERSVNVDLIADYDQNTKTASRNDITLSFTGVNNPGRPTIGSYDESIAGVELSDDGNNVYTVTVTGKKEGRTAVKFTAGEYTADLIIDVTAEVKVTADPTFADMFVNASSTVTIKAQDRDGNALSDAKWTVTPNDPGVCSVTLENTTVTVKGLKSGSTDIKATAAVEVNGETYSGSGYVVVGVYDHAKLGLANGTTEKYDEKTVDGVTVAANVDHPTATGLYIYATGRENASDSTNLDISQWTVSAVKIGSETLTKKDGYYLSSNYYAEIGGVQTQGAYTLRQLTVTSQTTGTVDITITMTKDGKNIELTVPYTLPAVTTHTVTFMSGTQTLKTQSVAWGQTATAPEVTEAPKGKRFDGWDKALGPIYKDTVINAVFVDADVNVTLHYNNNAPDAVVKASRTDVYTPPTPTRSGYYFIGWYRDRGFENIYTPTKPTADFDLYARWARYKLATSLTAGKTYVISNSNSAGSAYALTLPSGTSSGDSIQKSANATPTTMTKFNGSIYIVDAAPSSQEWVASFNGSYYRLSSGGFYLGYRYYYLRVYDTINDYGRLSYSNNVMKIGNNLNRNIVFRSDYYYFIASSSSGNIYLFEQAPN